MPNKKIASFLLSLFLLYPITILSEEKGESFWDNVRELGNQLSITKSQFLKTLEALEKDLEKMDSSEEEAKNDQVDIQDKIDTLRLRIDEIVDLKKSENEASSFTLLSSSKKDYRIKIDDVLSEIEPILFDGEVVNYSKRIQQAKDLIENATSRTSNINEELLFHKGDEGFFSKSKEDLEEEKRDLKRIIKRSETLIDDLEYDLKKKLNNLGIKVTREQIRVLTSRVDGDDLSKTFAIFDITKQISISLEELIKTNSFDSQSTIKYYGVYVLLSELLAYSQKQYIDRIDTLYLVALAKIKKDIFKSIEFTKEAIYNSSNKENTKILRQNIDSNEFALEVTDFYKDILLNQRKQLVTALEKTKEQISVAYSTYDTAAVSFNLLELINRSQDEFGKILNLQAPDIIPFENEQLANKFNEISVQISERI